jgi:hypothetical protein
MTAKSRSLPLIAQLVSVAEPARQWADIEAHRHDRHHSSRHRQPIFRPGAEGCRDRRPEGRLSALVCNTEGDASLERDYIQDLISHQVDGLIIAPVGDRSRR